MSDKSKKKAKREADLAPRPIPTVGAMPKLRVPTPATRVLANGLTVHAVRRPGIPLAQVRLILPTSRARVSIAEKARQRLLGRTLMGGTSMRTQEQIADQMQRIGGGLAAGADAEDLTISGSALSAELPALLAMLHEVLTDAAFSRDVVSTERDRTAQDLQVARSQPGVQAAIALGARLYGDHPYGAGLPDPADIAKVTSAQLHAYLTGRVGPAAGNLVLVSDLTTKRMLDLAEKALSGWTSGSPAQRLPAPTTPEPGPIVVVDRPGSVQTAIRVGSLVPGRPHADAPALTLASTIVGGYFSSRLTKNLREDKGWTYSPHAGVEHLVVSSRFTVEADVGTEFTAPALVEIQHELGRLATVAVSQDELDSARSYRTGALAIGLQTQAGLASQLAILASHGLDAAWLLGLPERFAAVTVDDVLRVARSHLAPARCVVILVGDAAQIVPTVEALGPVTVVAEA